MEAFFDGKNVNEKGATFIGICHAFPHTGYANVDLPHRALRYPQEDAFCEDEFWQR